MIIVYNSSTGFTKKYATLASQTLNIEAYPLDRLGEVSKAEDIIFFTHIHNDKILKINALKEYDVVLYCVVGAIPYSTDYINRLKEVNKLNDFFYFEGGISYIDTSYLLRVRINLIKNKLKRKNKKKKLTTDEYIFLSKIESGYNRINRESINLLVEWYFNRSEKILVS